MPNSNVWLLYVLMAGLCWGTYVPLIAFGGKNLSAGPAFPFAGRYAAFLCVGVAYVVIAVLFPLVRSFAAGEPIPAKPVGIVFASLAGVAGALGALGVIFATASAGPGDRIYIAPLIFTLAPLLNTVVSLFWHPTADHWFHFGLPEKMPSWMLFVGVVLVGVGAGMILLSKEKMEEPAGKPQAAQVVSPVNPPVQ
jgi:drug/metabolite transporter (DMT)-like permease